MPSRSARAVGLAASIVFGFASTACAPGPVFSHEAVAGWYAPLDPVQHHGRFATLPSGLRVVVYRFEQERAVTLQATFAGGEEAEPEGKAGVALLAARLAERASPGKGGISLLERRYAAGALTDVRLTADELAFVARLKPAYLRDVVATESDRIGAPAAGITEEMVEHERETLAEALEASEGDPSTQLVTARRRTLAGTLYGRPGPTGASVRALTLADVRDYLAAVIAPERCVLVVSSGLDPLETMKAVVDGLHGRAAAASGRPPYGAGRPPASPATPRELATMSLRTDERRLWLGWPVPGAAGGVEPATIATVALLQDLLSTRAAGPGLAKQVRGVRVVPQAGDLVSAVIAEVRLTKDGDALAVRAALEAAAAELHDLPQARGGRALHRVMRNARYLAHEGRAPIAEVARAVRTKEEPDPVRRFEEAAEAQLGPKLVEHLEAWLAPGRAAALLVEPRADDPVPAGDGAEAWRPGTWQPVVDLVAMAAPGAADVLRLVEPPGLATAVRERLPNGLEVVVLPRGAEPFVHARLYLPGGTAQMDEIVRARHALSRFEHRLPARGCQVVEGSVFVDGAVLELSAPAAGLRFVLEALACWTRDVSGGLMDPVPTPQDRLVRRTKAEALLAAPPPAEDDQADWYQRWLRRALSPAGATLVVTGALEAGRTLAAARELLGAWAPWPGATLPRRPLPAPQGRRAAVMDEPGAKRAHVTLAIRRDEPIATGPAAEDALLALLERELGLRLLGGRVEVEVKTGGGPGWEHWSVRLSGAVERIGPAVAIALAELDRLSRVGFGLAAADSARWNAARSAALTRDTAKQAADWLLRASSRRLATDAWERYPAELAAVDAASLRAALGQAAVGREGILASGDASVLRPALEGLGLDVQVVSPTARHGGPAR